MLEETQDFKQYWLGEEVETYETLVLSDLFPSHSRNGTALRTKSFRLSEKYFRQFMYPVTLSMRYIQPFSIILIFKNAHI